MSAVVGVLGELLITLGILLGLYVVWQLWWTDVQADRVQAQVLEEIQAPTPDAADVGTTILRDDPPVPAAPALGEVWGTLYVPRWDGKMMPIAEGTDKRSILDRAMAGHYPETVMPGGVGNFSWPGTGRRTARSSTTSRSSRSATRSSSRPTALGTSTASTTCRP